MEQSLINATTSSEPSLSLPITSDPTSSNEPETHLEIIARLERRVAELSHMVLHNRSFSQTPPHMTPSQGVRQTLPMPPPFPNLDEFNQTNYFTTSQPVRSEPLTQNVPFLFTATSSKAQFIPTTHDATNTHQVPPVYTYTTAPPMTQIQGQCRADVDHYVEVENEARSVNDEMINRKLKSLEDAMRSLRGLGSNQSVRYEELCAFPEVELPPGYKIPKFEKFDGSGNPFFHLKVYCEKLIGVGKNEGIRVKLFNQSLSGKALEWYSKQDTTKWRTWDDLANAFVDHYKFHVEIAPDRISITKLNKKSIESFREYAIRWREEASRVHPPMEETEMVTFFIQALEPEYYERLVTMGGKTFAEVIKAGDMIEDGIKTGRITSLAVLQSTSRAIQTGALGNGKRKEKEAASVMALGNTSYRHRQPPRYQPNAHHSQYFQYSPYPYDQALSSYQPQSPQISYPVYHTQPAHRAPRPPTYPAPPSQPHHPNNASAPRPNKPFRNFTPLGEPLSVVFERLQASGLVYPVEGRIPDPLPRSFDPTKTCAYHSGVKGHSTDRCYALKHKVEDLIEAKQITVKPPTPNVVNNPLPTHDGAAINMIGIDENVDDPAEFIVPVDRVEDHDFVAVASPAVVIRGCVPVEILGASSTPVEVVRAPNQPPVLDTKAVPWNYQQTVMECRGKDTITDKVKTSGMTRSGRCYSPEELVRLGQVKETNVPPKRVVTEFEAEEFLRKIKASEYSVVDQLKKTNAQIPILSLLLSSDMHRNALLKILNEAYVPSETTSEALAGMIERVLDSHRISFDNEELPPEGCMHNKALHITVKCRNMFVAKVLIDGGSGLNICPLTSLKKIGYNVSELKTSDMNIRAFDGAPRRPIGEIELKVLIGPVEFIMDFQVLDISTSYNMLLGRPWIHLAGAVPSTLHQTVKFEWDQQQICIHGEGDTSFYLEQSTPFIEAEGGFDGAAYHAWEVVNVTKEGEVCQTQEFKRSCAAIMVAKEMLRNGYQPGFGLGKTLNGRIEPVVLPTQQFTFGLGYEPTEEEVKKARKNRGKEIALPKPIPTIDQTFSKPSDLIVEVAYDDIVEGVKNLFVEDEDDHAAIIKDFAEILTL